MFFNIIVLYCKTIYKHLHNFLGDDMIIKVLFCALLLLFAEKNAIADEPNETPQASQKILPVNVTTLNNFPISQINAQGFTSVFDPLLENIEKKYNLKLSYDNKEENENTKLMKTRTGKADLILGVYLLTQEHSGLDIIYPSILGNPIKFITLNGKNIKIQSFRSNLY